jgi:hypothetical protein
VKESLKVVVKEKFRNNLFQSINALLLFQKMINSVEIYLYSICDYDIDRNINLQGYSRGGISSIGKCIYF